MANTLLTIASGASGLGDKDLEVYIDLDAVAKPNGGVPAMTGSVSSDYLPMAEKTLSAMTLSANGRNSNDDIQVYSLGMTGRDWLESPHVARKVVGISSLLFNEVSALSCASRLYACLSDGISYDFTSQTQLYLSAACVDAAMIAVNRLDAAMQPLRHKVAKLVNVNAVKNSIRQIFTWMPGERVINPEFGSMLRKYLYEPITEANEERIMAEIQHCVIKWEPRVVIDRVVNATSTDDVENNTVKLDIYYRIKGLNDQQFMYQYEYSRARSSYI